MMEDNLASLNSDKNRNNTTDDDGGFFLIEAPGFCTSLFPHEGLPLDVVTLVPPCCYNYKIILVPILY